MNSYKEGVQTYYLMEGHELTLDVLHHTMAHTPCRLEVKEVHSLQCFVYIHSEGRESCFSFSVCTKKNC